MQGKSLKVQFIMTFVFIIALSLGATIITYFGGYQILNQILDKKLYPANHFEKQIPDIESYIRKSGAEILNKKQFFDDRIPSEGILYQVLDENGQIVYGTITEQIINSREELYQKINTTIGIRNRFARVIPLFDEQHKVVGAVALVYRLRVHYLSQADKMWIIPLFTLIILSPFIYMVIFTVLFSKRLVGSIEKPIRMIIEASQKVKNKDLDFEIDYQADNELGNLCSAFNEMRKELKESLITQWKIEQERHEMVEALAHDLKTPFSVIQGYAEALLEDDFDDGEKNTKYLNVIKENAYKGSKLIGEMLYAAELENSAAQLQLISIDIERFLLRKKESYEMIAKYKNIKFQIEVLHNHDDKKLVPVDEVKLERILDNIVLNSIRYTPKDGIIRIHAEIQDSRIQFVVCDSGIGFSSKDLSNLFNKFYRGDPSRSSKDSHSDLGLYIVKKLVNMHGGSIHGFNSTHGGACIEFNLKIHSKDEGYLES